MNQNIGKAVIEPEGVTGTGGIQGVNIWGLVDTSQTANYQGITTTQTPNYSNIDTSQTPDWEEVA